MAETETGGGSPAPVLTPVAAAPAGWGCDPQVGVDGGNPFSARQPKRAPGQSTPPGTLDGPRQISLGHHSRKDVNVTARQTLGAGVVVWAVVQLSVFSGAQGEDVKARYERAESFGRRTTGRVYNVVDGASWLPDSGAVT